jgi:hypothetical protein
MSIETAVHRTQPAVPRQAGEGWADLRATRLASSRHAEAAARTIPISGMAGGKITLDAREDWPQLGASFYGSIFGAGAAVTGTVAVLIIGFDLHNIGSSHADIEGERPGRGRGAGPAPGGTGHELHVPGAEDREVEHPSLLPAAEVHDLGGCRLRHAHVAAERSPVTPVGDGRYATNGTKTPTDPGSVINWTA